LSKPGFDTPQPFVAQVDHEFVYTVNMSNGCTVTGIPHDEVDKELRRAFNGRR
jgi:hypothetical protein